MWLVDRVGRKPLLFAGLAGMTASLAALGVAQRFGSTIGYGPALAGADYRGVIGLYIVCFAFSMGPIVWLMISEIFPNQARARAGSLDLGQLDGKLSRQPFVSGSANGDGARYGSSMPRWVWGRYLRHRLRPETKGKSLEEISRQWRTRSRSPRPRQGRMSRGTGSVLGVSRRVEYLRIFERCSSADLLDPMDACDPGGLGDQVGSPRSAHIFLPGSWTQLTAATGNWDGIRSDLPRRASRSSGLTKVNLPAIR